MSDVQPSGTVTLVFTDVEGSTRLLEGLGRALRTRCCLRGRTTTTGIRTSRESTRAASGLLPLDPHPDLAGIRARAHRFALPPLIWPVTGAGRTQRIGELTT
jgi:hypothetical protein